MSELGSKADICSAKNGMSALPPKADIGRLGCDVRFVPIATKCTAANDGYSITSSARASNGGGTVEAERLGGLQVDHRSNFVGACTGRSAGFSPLRMRAAKIPTCR